MYEVSGVNYFITVRDKAVTLNFKALEKTECVVSIEFFGNMTSCIVFFISDGREKRGI